MDQLITPTPDIPCQPGWCLAYVNEAYGVPKRYGTATAAWNASETKHGDFNFPDGCWVPLWFSLATEPAGHVVLRAPDGSIYSTSHPTATTPTHHPDLADLFRAYSRYNPLTYLGWTEDVEGTPVVGASLSYESVTITPLEDDMPLTEQDKKDIARYVLDEVVTTEDNQPNTLRWFLASERKARGEVVGSILDGLFNRKVKVEGEGETGETSLAAEIGWFRNNFRRAQK